MRLVAPVMAALCALAAASALAAGAQDKPAAELTVRWKGASYTGDAIATAVGARAAATAQPWHAWAQAEGYALDLDPDLRALFVHPKSRSASAELSTLARVLTAVDKAAPRPAGAEPGALLVVFQLDGPEDLGSLLDELARRFPTLASWAPGAKQQTGFVLEEPLAAACLARAPDLEEWKPKNELVNRTAQLALFERCGRQPNWLAQGLAWHVELAVCNGIWCFPYRSGFVAKKEHRTFGQQLAAAMADRKLPLAIEDLAGWKRGTYEHERALLAWGAATFLARKHAAALPLILEDLRAVRAKEGRITKPDGTWSSIPDYEVPPEEQLAILKVRAGDDFFVELARFCAGG